MIDLTPEQLALVLQILTTHLPQHAKAFIFGSRATGTAKKFSDIDIAIDATTPLSLPLLASLNHEFEESDLPFKVDIVDWQSISNDFQHRILQHYLPILP